MSGLSLKRSGCFIIVLIAGCRRSEPPARSAPPVVEVARVEQRDVPIYGEWIATLDGYVNAQIQPRVTGYVVAQRAREGSLVKRNQVLFELDARPFRAVLSEARAELAQRRADEARTARDVERDKPLVEARALPKQQLENDIEAHRAAVAAVQAAQANVQSAELDVGYTEVRSLIDGIVGITEEQIGNLVAPTSVLTTVSQINPIRAWFAISEQEYLDPENRLHRAALSSATRGGEQVAFEMILSDGSKYSHKGSFLFANRQIDSLTGTIRIAASFPNPLLLLRPGQFARVRAATRVDKGALLVPQRAVNELQGTYQVMVMRADSTVLVQPVEVGPRIDSLWVIERGLQPSQIVIVEGGQRLKPGMKVAARPYDSAPVVNRVPAAAPARAPADTSRYRP